MERPSSDMIKGEEKENQRTKWDDWNWEIDARDDPADCCSSSTGIKWLSMGRGKGENRLRKGKGQARKGLWALTGQYSFDPDFFVKRQLNLCHGGSRKLI